MSKEIQDLVEARAAAMAAYDGEPIQHCYALYVTGAANALIADIMAARDVLLLPATSPVPMVEIAADPVPDVVELDPAPEPEALAADPAPIETEQAVEPAPDAPEEPVAEAAPEGEGSGLARAAMSR